MILTQIADELFSQWVYVKKQGSLSSWALDLKGEKKLF